MIYSCIQYEFVEERRPVIGWTVAFLFVQKEVFILMKKNNIVERKMGNYSSNGVVWLNQVLIEVEKILMVFN